MQALILIGGIGSRLGALVRKTPKPCLDVAGKPFVWYLLEQLRKAGIMQVVLLAGYQAEVVRSLFPENGKFAGQLEIEVVIEPEPLGTGGAIRYASASLHENFLLLNGDSYFDLDLAKFLQEGQQQMAECFMALRRVEDGSRYGEVAVAEGLVTRFVEKRAGARDVLINAGLYWCQRDLLQRFPEGASSLETDIFPQLVAAGQLSAVEYSGDFIDIGTPEDFQRAAGFFRKIQKDS